MTYIAIHFPEKYGNEKIYLKDIISEIDGIRFCIALMKEVLDAQVVTDQEPDIVIMSQVYIPVAAPISA